MRVLQLLSILFVFASFHLVSSSSHSGSFQRIVKRDTEPWKTLPATPDLPSGYVQHHLPINNGSIWYAVYEAYKGSEPQPPLVFLPGGFSSSTWFGYQIEHLLGSRKIIAIDARQQGRSTGSGNLTYGIMAGDVLNVLDQLKINERVDVVGWSDGAVITLNLLLNHPERLSRSFIFGANYNVSGVISTSSPVSDEAAARLKQIYDSINPKPNWANLVDTISTMWSKLPAWGESDFVKISNADGEKVWIVDGAHEEVVDPSQPENLAKWIDGSQKLILPDVSHYAFVQNPQEVNGALDDWLKIPA